jgi:hypothetical protein
LCGSETVGGECTERTCFGIKIGAATRPSPG